MWGDAWLCEYDGPVILQRDEVQALVRHALICDIALAVALVMHECDVAMCDGAVVLQGDEVLAQVCSTF
jgi:uncharacterized MnhB-related membrane protein